jgi:hypothetical protein
MNTDIPELTPLQIARGRATKSWVFPIISWVSQFAVTMPYGGADSLWVQIQYLIILLIQFLLLCFGIGFGIKSIFASKEFGKPKLFVPGIIGIVLSLGTLLLVISMFILVPIGGA